jgi:hypothetical protein
MVGGFVAASHAAWWIVAGCSAVVVALGLVVSSAWALATAERAAARLGTGDVGRESPAPATA